MLLTAMCSLVAAAAEPVEVFVDKDDTFIKAGKNDGLKVGDEVQLLGDRIGDTDEYRDVGSAMVMQVFERIARVAPDDEALKAGARKARLAVAVVPADASGVVAKPLVGKPLVGSALLSAFGPFKRVKVSNNTTFDWTNCWLRLPTNRRFRLTGLRAGDTEGIAMGQFVQDGMEVDRPVDALLIRCDEGSGKFVFSM